MQFIDFKVKTHFSMQSSLVWPVEFYASIHKSCKLIFYLNSQGCSVISNYYRKIIFIIFPRISLKKKFGFNIFLIFIFTKHFCESSIAFFKIQIICTLIYNFVHIVHMYETMCEKEEINYSKAIVYLLNLLVTYGSQNQDHNFV